MRQSAALKITIFTLLAAVVATLIGLSLPSSVTAQSGTPTQKFGCYGTPVPKTQLKVGMRAMVTFTPANGPTIPLRVRDKPGLQGHFLTQIVAGTKFTIIDGPLCTDGYLWWKIQTDTGVIGWVAEGDSNYYFIAPDGGQVFSPTLVTHYATANPNATQAPPTNTPITSPTAISLTPFVSTGAIGTVWGVAFSPDNRFLLTANDYRVRLWNTVTGEGIREFTDHTHQVTSTAYSPDGRYIVTGNIDHAARIWYADSGQQLYQLLGHLGGVYAVAFSPNGKYVLTGSDDHTAILWDLTTGKMIRQFSGHKKGIVTVAFSPDSTLIATGGQDNMAIIWSVDSGKPIHQFSQYTARVSSIAFSPDGKSVLIGSYEGTATLWSVSTGQKVISTGDSDGVTSVVFWPTGQYILTANNGDVRMWDASTGKQIRLFIGHQDQITQMAVAPNGKYLLTGSLDETARIWDTQTGQQLRVLGVPHVHP